MFVEKSFVHFRLHLFDVNLVAKTIRVLILVLEILRVLLNDLLGVVGVELPQDLLIARVVGEVSDVLVVRSVLGISHRDLYNKMNNDIIQISVNTQGFC